MWLGAKTAINTNHQFSRSDLKTKKTSSRISNTGKLDLRFATSLHERKHFLDLHLSSLLWQSFLSWFHCSSQIFTIVSLLKGKKISFPLYSPLGTLRYDNPFTQQERVIIHDICKTIFSAKIHQRLKYSLEISASLLQYSFLHESYELNDNDGSAPFNTTNPFLTSHYKHSQVILLKRLVVTHFWVGSA